MGSFGVVTTSLYIAGLIYLTKDNSSGTSRTNSAIFGIALCIASIVVAVLGFDWSWSSESILRIVGLVPHDIEDTFIAKLAFLVDNFAILIAAFAFGWLFIRMQGLRRELKRLSSSTSAGEAGLTNWLLQQLAWDPGNLAIRTELARAFLAEQNPTRAAVQARLVIDRDPYNYEATLLLATALRALRQHSVCARICQRYLAANPHCFELQEFMTQPMSS
jgi:hypothetical protein